MILRLHHLSLCANSVSICHQLNCEFLPGEIWGIIGKNGSGKTRFLHTLSGLLSPSGGMISLNQRLLSSFSSHEMATIIGVLFQENEISFPITVFEAVAAGRYPYLRSLGRIDKNSCRHIDHALKMLDLQPLATRLISTLSGGEKQRTHIATLLAQHPSIYLLDEPINHLDIYFKTKVLNHFQYLAKNQHALVIMALHDIHSVMQYCDKVLMFQENNMISVVSTQEISAEEIFAIFT